MLFYFRYNELVVGIIDLPFLQSATPPIISANRSRFRYIVSTSVLYSVFNTVHSSGAVCDRVVGGAPGHFRSLSAFPLGCSKHSLFDQRGNYKDVIIIYKSYTRQPAGPRMHQL